MQQSRVANIQLWHLAQSLAQIIEIRRQLANEVDAFEQLDVALHSACVNSHHAANFGVAPVLAMMAGEQAEEPVESSIFSNELIFLECRS